jgi:hypothetical protein
MKTKNFLNIFFLIIFKFCNSQVQDWEAHIGLSNRAEGSTDLIEYYDNGYYVEGAVEVMQQWGGWNVKTNFNGNLLWDKILVHDSYILYGFTVALDNEGNRFVAGMKFTDGTWPFITKFNPCGEDVWCKIIIDDEYGLATGVMDMVINENNEIIMLVIYDDELEIEKIFLEGFSLDGEVLWKKGYASKDNYPWISEPLAYDLMELNHEYYISGSCYWPFPNDTTHYYQRPLFIGIDSLFNEKWILPFYALDSVFGMARKTIAINDTLLMGVGARLLDNNGVNTLLMFYDINGNNVEYSQIPNDSIGSNVFLNYISEVERVNDTLFLSMLYLASEPGVALPFKDVVFDKNAKVYNLVARPPNAEGWAHIIKSSDGNFVNAMGWENPNGDKDIYLYKIDKNLQPIPFDTNTYTYDSLCPEQIQSGTIDLSACMVWTGAEEIPSPEEYYASIATIPINAYPNPAEKEITLAFENTEHHTNMLLECYNIYGQKVHSEKIWKGQQQTKLDVSGWSKGLHLAVVKSNGKVAGTGRFVKN